MKDIIRSYIQQPYPLWEVKLTKLLVEHKWLELRKEQFNNERDYSTSKLLTNYVSLKADKFPITENYENHIMYLESPSFDTLKGFYQEHGLNPVSQESIESNEVLLKLKSAMAIIKLVTPAYSSITKLVWAIQILKQEDPEIDVSYSHPKIPFSIFVSTCVDYSDLSNLRVAESILHEAMHLKLTLLENIAQLTNPNSLNLYYSPWREEERPINGVLHGLFVFRAIYEFYKEVKNNFTNNEQILNFLAGRLKNIKSEISLLTDFHKHQDLAEYGKLLAANLIEY